MTANAGMVPLNAARSEFWERFQRLAELRVREGNLVAGEPLWEIVRASGSPPRLTIRSTTCPTDFSECSLDPESGVLTCRPGPAIDAGVLRWQLLEGTSDTLRGCDQDCTVDQAVTWILDELVWIEDTEVK